MTTTAVTTITQSPAITSVTSWTELVKTIDEADGIALVPMETLRKLEGAQRLGIHVLKAIGARLGTLGIGHMPDVLPNRQDQDAILYRYGTPASEVISAVRNGLRSAQDVRNTYRALYKLNTTPEPTEIVHREELDDKLTTAAKAVLDLLGESGRDLLK
jgi:hypothetical protein